MVERGAGGHVVNIASAAGLVAIESLAAYCTTKFSVVGLSEALRDELHRYRIGVTCVCPGLVNTPITRAAKLVGPLASEVSRAAMIQTYERRNFGPELVASRILRAVERNRALAPITPEAWGLYLMKRFAPRLLAWLVRVAGARGRAQLAVRS
jgi:short-subunit dehydrogenase